LLQGGLHGGGLFSSTAEVWFLLSKQVVIVITHGEPGEEKFVKYSQRDVGMKLKPSGVSYLLFESVVQN
jgi:hypothetical protein